MSPPAGPVWRTEHSERSKESYHNRNGRSTCIFSTKAVWQISKRWRSSFLLSISGGDPSPFSIALSDSKDKSIAVSKAKSTGGNHQVPFQGGNHQVPLQMGGVDFCCLLIFLREMVYRVVSPLKFHMAMLNYCDPPPGPVVYPLGDCGRSLTLDPRLPDFPLVPKALCKR